MKKKSDGKKRRIIIIQIIWKWRIVPQQYNDTAETVHFLKSLFNFKIPPLGLD